MSDPVTLARARATIARGRLTTTFAEVQARLAPRAIASDAAASVVEKSHDLAQQGVDTARRYPVPVGGAVAAIGLFLFRRPILGLLKRRKADSQPSTHSINERRTAAPKRKPA